MILRSKNRLDEIIVEILGTKGSQTATELKRYIDLKKRSCSIQGVYFELRKLQTLGVILKVRETYHLNITWASELMDFADNVYELYINSANADAILPEPNKTKSWTFSDLFRMDDFWVQIMQILFVETGHENLFGAMPHPWYYFSQPKKVLDFYSYALRQEKKLNYIISKETFLANLYTAKVDPRLLEYSYSTPEFEVDHKSCTICMPPYIMSYTLDQETYEAIDNLFMNVKSNKDMTYERINLAINLRKPIKVKIEHKERKAKRLEKNFREYFAI